jgi:proliferating cell nuclear antigen
VCEARLVQGSLLKKTLEALEGLLDEAVWDWSSTGLQIQTIDRFHVSLVSVSLRANGFDKFKCNHDLHTGFDHQILSNILKCAGDDDTITINAEDQGDKLTFIFESPNQKIIQHYELKLWDLDSEQLGIPENNYLAVIKLPSNLFERIIKDLGQFAISILIECFINGVIQFSSSDISTSGKIKLTQTANVEKVEEAVTIDIWEPLSLTFAAEHLRLFAKASFLAPQVTLSMSRDVPLVVEYKVGGIGHIRYYLAPKMEEYHT